MRKQLALPLDWDDFTVVERFGYRQWATDNGLAVEGPYVHPIHLGKLIKHLLLGWTNAVGQIKGGGTPQNYQQQIIVDNPSGYWRMDENGTQSDLGDGPFAPHDLTELGAAHPAPAAGLLFDDTPNLCATYLGIGVPFEQRHSSSNNAVWPTSEEAISLECWFQAGVTPPNDRTCCEVRAPNAAIGEKSAQIQILTGSEFIQGSRAASVISSTPDVYADAATHHVVLTCPARIDPVVPTVHLYVDDIDYGTAQVGGPAAPGALHQVNVGADRTTTVNEEWLGKVDEVAVYLYELSAAQVTQHYNAGKFGTYS